MHYRSTQRSAMRQLVHRYRIRYGAIDRVASVSTIPAPNHKAATQRLRAFAYCDHVFPARGSRITGDWLLERLWNRAKSHLQSKIDELQADMEEVGDLVAYFLKAALHYHSIENLRKAVATMKKFTVPLS